MTKTYELPNEKMIMADVDEKHHTATISVYVLDDLVEAANKADVLDKIRAEISDFEEEVFNRPNTDYSDYAAVRYCLEIIDKYRNEVSE